MGFLASLQPARDLFFKSKAPDEAEALLLPLLTRPSSDPQEQRATHELMGLALRAQGKYTEAMALYIRMQDWYQAGYCALLQGDLQAVQTHWTQVLTLRPTHWCLSLYGMIMQQLRTYPTLFQIRNHLESDIANLLAANRIDYLENLLGHIEFLAQINLESPKFAGRALMHAGWLPQAGPFLIRGQKALPNDPEIYFHLGQYSMALQHTEEARLMLKQCLLISPTYYPASELLAKIAETS